MNFQVSWPPALSRKVLQHKWAEFEQKLKGSSYWGLFSQRWQFLLVSLGEGFRVWFRWVVGGRLPLENKGKGGVGRGVGWGPAKEPASQCASFVRNYPLAIYPNTTVNETNRERQRER